MEVTNYLLTGMILQAYQYIVHGSCGLVYQAVDQLETDQTGGISMHRNSKFFMETQGAPPQCHV